MATYDLLVKRINKFPEDFGKFDYLRAFWIFGTTHWG